VYDALNVLEAMDIIVKEKKLVRWCGFPETNSGLHFLRQRKIDQAHQIEAKQQKLKALIGQLVSYKQLIQRNRDREQAAHALSLSLGQPTASMDALHLTSGGTSICHATAALDVGDVAAGAGHARQGDADHTTGCGPHSPGATLAATASASSAQAARSGSHDESAAVPSSSASASEGASCKLQMPFLLVATQTPTYVDCAMADDQKRALLTFQHQFSIHDDSEVLRCLGLHRPATEDVLSQLLSPELARFAHGHGEPVPPPTSTPRASF
jgi:hypothetical protein